MIFGSLIVKIAIVYAADKTIIRGSEYVPTVRVSAQLAPKFRGPGVSLAISEIDEYGACRPLIIYKLLRR